ncbi:MAG: class I SAM-dependent methyltransferase [Candidatus Obscuribacterales bacterium]|nr:class I SAM-dependent methyltransferase [Candidatus Obscuribacterales bacterium]
MRVHEIGQFYGERKGWRMFDAKSLTPEIKRYLNAESEFLARAMQNGYGTLIEVGCGYGRYMEWALSRNFGYLGLDIVPWLVDMGQLRAKQAQLKFPNSRAAVILHAAEDLDKILKNLSADHPLQNSLVFFPFNCLGNVAHFDMVLDALKNAELDVLVSTFKTDASATKIRKDYYKNCGYEKLNSRILKQGLLIVSEEGFHAMAYHEDILINAFKKRGFEAKELMSADNLGCLAFFSFKRDTAPSKTSATDDFIREKTGLLEATLYLVSSDTLLDHSSGEKADGSLLSFSETQIHCYQASGNYLEAESRIFIPEATAVRLVLPLMLQEKEDMSSGYADLVAEISNCSSLGNGLFKITLTVKGSDSAILERFISQSAKTLSP